MSDTIQSSTIHSSTTPVMTGTSPFPAQPPHHFPAGAAAAAGLWSPDLGAHYELWGGVWPPQQLWDAHPGTHYHQEILGFGHDIWSGAQRQHSTTSRLGLSKAAKKRRRVATMAQRRAANIRERRRMFNLNEAFDRLRTKVPTFAYEKRLSRIETLKLAITYISFMDELLAAAAARPALARRDGVHASINRRDGASISECRPAGQRLPPHPVDSCPQWLPLSRQGEN